MFSSLTFCIDDHHIVMDCFLLNRRKDGPEWSIRPANVQEIEPLRMTNSRNVSPPVKVRIWYLCMHAIINHLRNYLWRECMLSSMQ